MRTVCMVVRFRGPSVLIGIMFDGHPENAEIDIRSEIVKSSRRGLFLFVRALILISLVIFMTFKWKSV